MAVEDLERALQSSWDRDHLAVYGDALQARGDPRGELIAIDLAGEMRDVLRKRATTLPDTVSVRRYWGW